MGSQYQPEIQTEGSRIRSVEVICIRDEEPVCSLLKRQIPLPVKPYEEEGVHLIIE